VSKRFIIQQLKKFQHSKKIVPSNFLYDLSYFVPP